MRRFEDIAPWLAGGVICIGVAILASATHCRLEIKGYTGASELATLISGTLGTFASIAAFILLIANMFGQKRQSQLLERQVSEAFLMGFLKSLSELEEKIKDQNLNGPQPQTKNSWKFIRSIFDSAKANSGPGTIAQRFENQLNVIYRCWNEYLNYIAAIDYICEWADKQGGQRKQYLRLIKIYLPHGYLSDADEMKTHDITNASVGPAYRILKGETWP